MSVVKLDLEKEEGVPGENVVQEFAVQSHGE